MQHDNILREIDNANGSITSMRKSNGTTFRCVCRKM